MRPVAIFLYELSGKSAEPFAAAGWDCYCIDIAHERDRTEGNIHFVKADARHWMPTKDMVLRCRFFAAFPPCDHLAISGSRWFRGKGLHALAGSVELFAVAAEWAEFLEVPYFIENPVSTIATYWRKPDHKFDPWQFTTWAANDNYTKKTCLWTGGGFVMPPEAAIPGPLTRYLVRSRVSSSVTWPARAATAPTPAASRPSALCAPSMPPTLSRWQHEGEEARQDRER